MSSRLPLPDRIERAERAVREYFAIALASMYAHLDIEDVLCEAEGVWDNYQPGCDTQVLEEGLPEGPESDIWKALIRELHAARCGRFGDERFFLFSVCPHRDGDEHSITCDLMWPDSNHIHAMRIFVTRDLLTPPDLN